MSKPRAAASNVTVSLGALMSMTGNLYSPVRANAAKEESSKLACPKCETPTAPQQRYVCEEHDPAWTGTQTECARMTPDGSKFVDPEALKDAKTSDLEKGLIALTVHPAAEVAKHTFTGGASWIFRPGNKASAPLYSLLLSVANDPELALLANVNLGRSSEKLVRLTVTDGELTFKEVVRPEDRAALADPETVAVSEMEVQSARALLEALCEDFDPGQYNSVVRQRIKAIVASTDGKLAVTPTTSRKEATPDVSALLEAALAAAQAKSA